MRLYTKSEVELLVDVAMFGKAVECFTVLATLQMAAQYGGPVTEMVEAAVLEMKAGLEKWKAALDTRLPEIEALEKELAADAPQEAN